MAVKNLKINNVEIASPDAYKPVFSTTSTEDSGRDQNLDMHNTPIGTIAGYDLTWDYLTADEAQVILSGMLNKSKFLLYHPDPSAGSAWISAYFYASDYNMEAVSLANGDEIWKGLSISVRRVDAI